MISVFTIFTFYALLFITFISIRNLESWKVEITRTLLKLPNISDSYNKSNRIVREFLLWLDQLICTLSIAEDYVNMLVRQVWQMSVIKEQHAVGSCYRS